MFNVNDLTIVVKRMVSQEAYSVKRFFTFIVKFLMLAGGSALSQAPVLQIIIKVHPSCHKTDGVF